MVGWPVPASPPRGGFETRERRGGERRRGRRILPKGRGGDVLCERWNETPLRGTSIQKGTRVTSMDVRGKGTPSSQRISPLLDSTCTIYHLALRRFSLSIDPYATYTVEEVDVPRPARREKDAGSASTRLEWTTCTSRPIHGGERRRPNDAQARRPIPTRGLLHPTCQMHAAPHHVRRGKAHGTSEERDPGRLHVGTRSMGTPSDTQASFRRAEATVVDDATLCHASDATIHVHEEPRRCATTQLRGTHQQRTSANLSTVHATTSEPQARHG